MKQPSRAPLHSLLLRAAFGAAALCRCAAGISVAKSPVGLVQQNESQAPAKLDFDHLRRSVVRISAVTSRFDWLHPFVQGHDGVGLGSGFVVQVEPYPLFVTNAHVIRDAKQVSLQLLLYGAEQFSAEVVSVCSKFDLALVVLKDHQRFTKALSSQGIKLEALKLADGIASMGQDVVALGFPLGQDALKISKGNVAGNEDVNGNICIQSTAPISPGNSGGPLLDAAGREVVGVNFAKATKGENINYVIPVWRVKQMISKHLKDQPGIPKNGSWQRVQVKVPKLALTTIVPNEALYELHEGCKSGIFISKVGSRSPFRKAEPPVEEGSFLVAINGKKLDRFGSGMNQEYVADRVAFTDLLWMTEGFFDDIAVETCREGKASKHTVSMAWSEDYERGLQYIDEPYFAQVAERYELFGGVSVMQMTVNHVRTVMRMYRDPGPARWLHPDHIGEPRLVINYVQRGSYPESIFATGSAVSKLNGVPVRTLEEFREHFEPKNGTKMWTLESDMGELLVLKFTETLDQQVQTGMRFRHLLTNAVVAAAKRKLQGPGIAGAPTSHKDARAMSLATAEAIDVAPLDAPPAAAGPLLVRAVGSGRRGVVVDDALHGEQDADVEFLMGDVPASWDEPLA
mmetsp:Transcript_64689/g.186034  ORF Transcript_64689/g.186034 Transcript_64689/m.186034 type:complete len:628 (+) Transcript_64689:64-1947(+)